MNDYISRQDRESLNIERLFLEMHFLKRMVQKIKQLFWVSLCVIALSGLAFQVIAADNRFPPPVPLDFKTLFNQQNVIMLLINPDTGQIVDANPAASQFYGYSTAQLKTMHIQQINQLSVKQVAEERLLAAKQGRNYFIFQHRLANGEIRTVGVSSHPYQFNGQTLLLSVINDMTPVRQKSEAQWVYSTSLEKMVDAQKQMLEGEKGQKIKYLLFGVAGQILLIGYLLYELRRRSRLQRRLAYSDNTLNNIMNAATSVAIVTTDKDGLITGFNEGAERLLGYSAEEVVGQHSPRLFHWDVEVQARRQKMEAEYGLIDNNMDVFTLTALKDGLHKDEWTYVCKDGRQVPVSLMVTPIYDEHSVLLGYLGMAHDISDLKKSERETLKIQHQLRATLDAIPDLLFEVNAEDEIVSYHTADSEHLYASPDDFLGKKYQEVLPVDAAKICQQALVAAKQSNHASGFQYGMQTPTGYRYYELSVSCNQNEDGLDHYVVLARDITARVDAQKHLKSIANVFVHAREGITIADVNGDIVDVNQGFTDITGYSREEVIGKNPRFLKSNRQSSEFYEHMWAAVHEKGFWTGEMWNRHKNGQTFAEIITISAVRDEQGQIQNYLGIFTDITAHKESQQHLEHIAHYDLLTQLPNRALLDDRLKQAVLHADRQKNALALLFIDLDGFKEVNDLYGHEVGDELLIHVANSMKAAMRDEDTLARLGGDEFVAILVDLDEPQDCEPVLARMLSAASDAILIEEKLIKVSASIGVTVYPNDQADSDLLIRHADQAMYQAKQEGKNRFRFFDIDQDALVRTQSLLLAEIKQALQKNEFVLHYQPKVNFQTEEVSGVEALIRWQHPQKGLLQPGAFLPLIHEHPLSIALDEWVMTEAMKQWRIWHEQGVDLCISINISAITLQQKDFMQRMEFCFSKYPSIASGALQLEILETSALENIEHVQSLMEFCQKLGVEFALDDFGTGYSSLTYLRHLPAKVIKIDQSFVRDMLVDNDDLAIIEGILKLSQAFGRDVIAEGAETFEQCQKLYQMGCFHVQGYAIARPMDSKDLMNWVQVVSKQALHHISGNFMKADG